MSEVSPDGRPELLNKLAHLQKDIERTYYASTDNAAKMEKQIRKAMEIMDSLGVFYERNLLLDTISKYLTNYRSNTSKKDKEKEFERARSSSALLIKTALLSLA
jgi:hypothetical protein